MAFKRTAVLFLLIAAALSLLFSGTSRADETKKADYTWRFAVPWPRPLLQASFEKFCELVHSKTKGRMEIKLFPDGLLGNHDETFHGVRIGDVDVAMLVPYVSLVPGGVVNFMPWTVTNYEEFGMAFSVPGGILHKVMEKAYNEVNMHVLFSISGGGYGLGNNERPLATPADLKNLKIRVSSSLGMVRALGNMGKGTGMTMETVPWSELYNALSRRVVDGCWTTPNLLVAERQYEVMKYFTNLGFAWDSAQIAVNRQTWEALPPELQKEVTDAAVEAAAFSLAAQKGTADKDFALLKEKGLQIHEPTAEEKALFFDASRADAIWEELVRPWMDKAFPGEDMTGIVQEELRKIREATARAQ